MTYATIIIPTHDRASTLAISIESALAQTIRDIELIVVGDGCTPQVREIAQAYAARDDRVTFLDRPKGARKGAVNRDFAVRAARADRIFYNDDDDLLLPNHVEALGSALDRADIADTPAVSFHPGGRISRGVHDSGAGPSRRLLGEQGFKEIFDTHLAHRKSAYVGGAGAWLDDRGEGTVLGMLQHFARDAALSWVTIDRITAVSFHGASRSTMTDADRRLELLNAHRGLEGASDAEAAVADLAGHAFYAFRLFTTVARHAPDELNAVRAAVAERMRSTPSREILSAVFDLAGGRAPGREAAVLALDELIEARLASSLPTPAHVARYVRLFGRDAARAMVRELQPRPVVTLAQTLVDMGPGMPMNVLEAVVAQGSASERPFLGWALFEGLKQVRHPGAWDWQARVRGMLPESKQCARFFRLVAALGKEQGRDAEAAEAGAEADRLAALDT